MLSPIEAIHSKYAMTQQDIWEMNFIGALVLYVHDNLLLVLRAMSSPANKEQFLKQFEQIVEGIKQNREKVCGTNLSSVSNYLIH